MPAIAYYFSRFPLLSTTFLQREVRALEDAGVPVVLVSNSKPFVNEFHTEDLSLRDRTIYLSDKGPSYLAVSVVAIMITRPAACLLTLALLIASAGLSLGQWKRCCKYFILGAALARLCRREQIHHLHVHFAFGAAGAARFCKSLGGPSYSVSVHGSDILISSDMTEEKLRGADFIISNCRYHCNYVQKRFPPIVAKRFHVVPIGLDLSDPLWAPTAIEQGPPPLRVLTIGRLVPVKAQHVLIEACGLLRDRGVELRVRIGGEGPLRERLIEQINRLKLDDRVKLLGPLNQSGVSKSIAWSHVVVLSSLSEGTPMVLMEAMARARPVIAPDMTGIPEVIDEGYNGHLFAKGSAVWLAATLKHLSSLTVMDLTRLGACGRRKVEEHFDLRRNVRRRVEIFRSEVAGVQGGHEQEEI